MVLLPPADDDVAGISPTWGDERAAVDLALDLARERILRDADPTTGARTPLDLARLVGRSAITAEGIGAQAALDEFVDVLLPATRAQNGRTNVAYIPAAPTRAALAFDAVTSATNVFGGLWEAGAGAIHAENEVLAWITRLLDWPDTAQGCFVGGGTLGNLSALVAARVDAAARRPRPPGGWVLACAATAHSSIAGAARAMDVGVLAVPVDDRGHLTGAALAAAVAGRDDVFAVVASAGTTNAGLVDDLDTIADVCGEHGLWLHVDGAYGGAGLAAPSVRERYRGIERADSFIVDPHKWLFAPYDCCALVYREPARARAAHSQHAHYLDAVDRATPNPSDLALHLSRRVRGLPLWFSLATHGTDRYTEAIERSLTTARTVADAIRATDHLRLVREPELSVLLFERIGWTPGDYARWSVESALAGRVLCVPTEYDGRTVLRMAFVNPDTDPAEIVAVLP